MNFAETKWQEFPNGRRRREIVTDNNTGQKFEKYVGDVQEVGNEALKSPAYENTEYYYDDELNEPTKAEEVLTKESFVSLN